MFEKIADNQNSRSLAVQLRRKRFAFFGSLLSNVKRPVYILDIGGTVNYWRTMQIDSNDELFITLLNQTRYEDLMPNMNSIAGDARTLEMEDGCFDVVFSNSVIEHVGTYNDQMQMAKEVMRVGKRYFVQTPNKYFPIEPHFLFPFFQFLPISLRVQLLRHFNLGWYAKIPDEAKARQEVETIRLLTRKEFAGLFPAARIYQEKILGLTKSFIAYDGWK